jgi:hypothetical protein
MTTIIQYNIAGGALRQYEKAGSATDIELVGQHFMAAVLLERLYWQIANAPSPHPLPYPVIDPDECDCRPDRGQVCPVCANYAHTRYPQIPFEGEI